MHVSTASGYLFIFRDWAERVRLARKLAFAFAAGAVVSGIATYITITEKSNPLGPDPKVVVDFILIDLVFLLGLATIVSIKVVKLWLERLKGGAGGSRLQTRIILMFSLVSIIPTIIVASFSALFFNFGIQTWFNERVSNALEESVAVAESYLSEHKEAIRGDVLAMANDLTREAYMANADPLEFEQLVSGQAAIRSLTEAIVFKRHGSIVARSNLSFSLLFDLDKITDEDYRLADSGEVVIITPGSDERVRALVKLDNFFDTYLLVGRLVDSRVINHIESTRGSVNEYTRLKNSISRLQIKFSFVFIGVALLLLLAAVWFGMVIAGELVKPIASLVRATGRIKEGDLSARVDEGPENDEIGTLGRAFNSMADQLEKQRSQLIEVNRQIDARRRFSEVVLSGVSAGVVALDADSRANLFNASALELLSQTPFGMQGVHYTEFFPEIEEMLGEAEKQKATVQKEINIVRGEKKSTLLVRIAVQMFADRIEGCVITFDDITELKSAERSRAWSDVARRIAHEIKNPLTPIHLSAERLKKKYSDQITSGKENYIKYVDTIIAHVGDIGRMVEEFAEFARMPAPVMVDADICVIARDAVFSQKSANPNINYEIATAGVPVIVNCDPGQIGQVFSNILKNAAEGIETRKILNPDWSEEPSIKIKITKEKDCVVEISDNGNGLPPELIDRLTEPYITTREKGTGLGLAIVKKIMSDHQGKLILKNINNGTCVSLYFQVKNKT